MSFCLSSPKNQELVHEVLQVRASLISDSPMLHKRREHSRSLASVTERIYKGIQEEINFFFF